MRKIYVVLVIYLLCIPYLVAECDGAYIYSESWIDEQGAIVSTNLTSVPTWCDGYAAYAEATLSLPNSYSQFDSADDPWNAEAIVGGPMLTASEEGEVILANSILSACYGGMIFDPFPVYLSLAETKVVWTGSRVLSNCIVTPACSNTTLPRCYVVAVNVAGGVQCSPAWNITFLSYRIGSGPYHCVPLGLAVPTQYTFPEPCTPP